MKIFTVSLALCFALTALWVLPFSITNSQGAAFSFVTDAHAKKEKTVAVKNYKKKDGTKVKKHTRSK